MIMKLIIYFAVIILSVIGCKIEEPQNPPTVITNAASNITFRIATLNGEVTNEGFSAASDRGFVYSEKNSNPSVSDSKAQSGYGKGVYTKSLDNLLVNTKYYFKAYASNTKGTSYGEVQTFISGDYEYKLPTAITDIPKNIGYSSVEIAGSVTDEGGGSVSESGFVYSLTTLPTINDNKVPLSKSKGLFKFWVNKLKSSTKYFVRSYAINEKGTAYGNEQSFTTLNVTTVTSKTGRVWMDRNLGATQVMTLLFGDNLSYGDFYQWGRLTDGHQLLTSINSAPYTYSLVDIPNNELFLITPDDWRKPKNDNLWQGVNGINNVCPTGFRIPTSNEWEQEITTWISKNNQGAFASPLKLPGAGERSGGEIIGVSYGTYWSSTVIGDGANVLSFAYSNGGSAYIYKDNRVPGHSVRCIKD